jgi:hypothetical protein
MMITGPIVITEPGTYRLANDIVNSAASVCIDIRVDGVTIDGQGFLVDGVGAPDSSGVRIAWTRSDAPDTIVRNLRLANWDAGIDLYKAVHPNVLHCAFRENAIGINGYAVNDAEIRSSTFFSNGAGVSLSGASEAVISDCSFSKNTFGISLGQFIPSSSVSIRRNTIDRSEDTAILVAEGSGPVVVESNRITSSGRAGLVLNGRSGHRVWNNLFNNQKNAEVTGQATSTWSVRLTKGKNIIGGNRIGGNYWAQPDGNGFSQVTPDRNRDGFCDAAYSIDPMNRDDHPLHRR